MKMKRIASGLLALLMVLTTLVIVPVSATEAVPTVDAGYKAIAEGDRIPADKEGAWPLSQWRAKAWASSSTDTAWKAVKYVYVDSVAAWKEFGGNLPGRGAFANATKGVTFYLIGDLDFEGTSAIIGECFTNGTTTVSGNQFQGTFDGNGYTIKNLVVNNDIINSQSNAARVDTICVGLFARLAGTATVKNLIIDSSCSFTQTNLTNNTSTSKTRAAVGAVAGNTADGATIENVWNKANVTGIRNVGGLAGETSGNITVKNCTNDGTVIGGEYIGGMLGATNGVTVTNCVNNGIIAGNTGANAGGICGRVRGNATVSDCVNNGSLRGTGYKWNGILTANTYGSLKFTYTITNCVNTARFNLDYFKAPKTTEYTEMVPGIFTAYKENASITNAPVMNCTGCYSVLDPYSIEVYAGYSDWRVGKPVDLTNVPDIKSFTTINADTTLNGKAVADDNPAITAYKVTDAEGMQKLSDFAKTYNFQDKTIYLANDIDLSSITNFEPIGPYGIDNATCASSPTAGGTGYAAAQNMPFKGTFDGQGHTVDGLRISFTREQRSAVGLFGDLQGTVKNLIIGSNSYVEVIGAKDDYLSAGAIAGRNGTIENCANYASVYAAHNASGLSGRGATCKYSTNYGYVRSLLHALAFSGLAAGDVTQCANYGVINGDGASALVHFNGAKTVKDTYNGGVMNSKACAAGIAVARAYTITVTGCEIEAPIVSRQSTKVEKYVVGDGSDKPTVSEKNNTFAELPVGYSKDLIIDVDLTNIPDITSVYTMDAEGNFALVDGKQDVKVMKISDAEGMRLFSAFVNVYDADHGFGCSFYLANDIDMSEYTYADDTKLAENTFVPVGWANQANDNPFSDGNGSVGFQGYFNGMGHSINNFKFQTTNGHGAGHIGIFGMVKDGTVTNLVVDDSVTVAPGGGNGTVIGMVACNASNAVFANVWNQASCTYTGTREAGGIISSATITGISNATNSGNITAARNGAGGIIGRAYIGEQVANNGRVMIVNSRNVGEISSAKNDNWSKFAGGIIGGDAYANTLLVNVENYGTVTAYGDQLPGGLFGNCASGVQYANCYNFGALKSENGTVVEGNQINGAGIAPTKNTTIAGINTDRDTAYVNDMLYVGYQDNGNDVRLITTIDSLVYDKIVLTITNAEGKKATVTLTGVYTTILAGEIGDEGVVDPASYGVDTSLYFATLTLTDAAGKTFTVQASAYVGDTAVLVGEARTITVGA